MACINIDELMLREVKSFRPKDKKAFIPANVSLISFKIRLPKAKSLEANFLNPLSPIGFLPVLVIVYQGLMNQALAMDLRLMTGSLLLISNFQLF